jgi:glucosylceramidase
VWLAVLGGACLTAAGCPNSCGLSQLLNPTSVQSVSVSPASAQLTVGQTQQFTATVLPSGVSNRSVTWSVAPAAMATIDDNGVLKALAVGQATVTATTVATPTHTAEAAATIVAATAVR